MKTTWLSLVIAGGLGVVGLGGARAQVRLNEVLANNASGFNPAGVLDWVELHNPTAAPLSLAGAALSDGSATPLVFGAGVVVPARGFLVVYCDSTSPASATNTGFGLKASGGLVTLVAANGGVLDSIRYGIQAPDFSIGRVTDGSGSWVLNTPTPGAVNVAVPLDPPDALRVNEWMANPRAGSDYFELYNPGLRPVALGGLRLTDTLSQPERFVIPALSFIGVGSVGGYTLFYAANGTDGNYTGFGLSSSGDAVGLFNGAIPIDTVTFGLQRAGVSQGRLPDGGSDIVLFVFSPTPGAPNRDLGTLSDIVINEVLTHTDPPLEDAIEFRNMTEQPVNMKGWYFVATENDDLGGAERYTFPADFVVPANGYRVLYQAQIAAQVELRFNSAHGGAITLYQVDDAGSVVGFVRRAYDSAENGVSFGYTLTSEGADWVALSPRTFGVDSPSSIATFRRGNGLPNGGAKVGPVVINEIHYHPPDVVSGGTTNDNSLDEFIELRNITSRLVPLYDPATYRALKTYSVNGEIIRAGQVYADGSTNTWRIRGDVEFDMPTGIDLPPGGLLLVVNFNPATNAQQLAVFKGQFAGIPPDVRIVGPYSGKLNNGGGTIELKRPDAPQGPNHLKDFRYVPYLMTDKIKYKDSLPWPVEADGTSASLQRRSPHRHGNEPLNWKAEPPTPGVRNAEPVVLHSTPQNLAYIAGNVASFGVVATGTEPLHYQWSFNGTNLPGATNPVLLLENLQLSQVGRYMVTVSNDESTLVAEALLRVDSVKPLLTVTSPKPNTRWSNDVILVEGTVRDDFGVAQVLVRLNGGEFLPATGTTNWSLPLSLAAGTNVIQVTAVDLGNNRAPTNTLRIFRVSPSRLTLVVEGLGTVAPQLGGQLLEVGRRFTLTATPGVGQLFSNWSGGVLASANPLTFAMESNLVLRANFVPNPFTGSRGIYNGLFFNEAAPAHGNAGFFTATVAESGGFTASIQFAGKKYSFSGKFDLDGRATGRVSLGGTNGITFGLVIDLAGDFRRLRGAVVGAGWTAALLAEPAGYLGASPTTLAGPYTLNLRGNDAVGEPAGDGYGTVVVSPAGSIALSGALADATKLSQKTAVTRAGNWPLYASLYGGKGSVVGWLRFVDGTPLGGIEGDVLWTKPAVPNAKLHRNAFAATSVAVGSRHVTPAPGARLLDLSNATVVFTGGDLPEPLSFGIELTSDNKVINLATANKMTMTLTAGNGLMGGSFVDPASGRTFAFKGALLENLRSGGGAFAGTNESGRVRLVP